MRKSPNIKSIMLCATLCVWFESGAFARRVEIKVDAQELARNGLAIPNSAAMFNLEKVSGNELAPLCPLIGFRIEPKQLPSDEKISRALRIQFQKGRPAVDECIRGSSSCFAASLEQNSISKENPTNFTFNGRAGSYKINITSAADIPARPIDCRSSAVEILQNTRGVLALPSTLWVLNYEKEIVLWDGTQKQTWFRFQLPERQTLNEKFTAVANTDGRILIYDNTSSFLFVDFNRDKVLLKTNAGLFESSWGVGGTRYSSEWQFRSSSVFPAQQQSQSAGKEKDAQPFVGLAGFVQQEEFWSWDEFLNSLQGLPYKAFSLGGSLLVGSERISESESEVHLAVKKSSDLADIMIYKTGSSKLQQLKTNQRVDVRAQKSHFMVIGNSLYRHTADGIYTVDSENERPSNMRGFSGRVEAHPHVAVTRTTEGKNCALNVWPVFGSFAGILEPVLGPVSCSKTHGLGVSPWGHSITWREGKTFKAILSTHD